MDESDGVEGLERLAVVARHMFSNGIHSRGRIKYIKRELRHTDEGSYSRLRLAHTFDHRRRSLDHTHHSRYDYEPVKG